MLPKFTATSFALVALAACAGVHVPPEPVAQVAAPPVRPARQELDEASTISASAPPKHSDVVAEAPAAPQPPVTVAPPARAADPAPTADPIRGQRLLARVHPWLRQVALDFAARAAREGIAVRFISGFRPYRRKPRGARGGRASWHNFGLAFDVNLMGRRSMKDAKKSYAADRAQWERLGALAKAGGLTWGGTFRRPDIFHFEWHPGFPAYLDGKTLERLQAVAGPKCSDFEKTWTLLEPWEPQGSEGKI